MKPKVSVIVATTVDGKITTSDNASSKFASRRDLEYLLEVRSHHDAILAGAKTITNDDPTFTTGYRYQNIRQKQGLPPNPIKCVVSGKGSVLPTARMFHHNDAPAAVFTTEQIPNRRLRELSEVATVYYVGQTEVDFGQILRILADHYGVQQLLIEGGGSINAAAFKAGIVDDLYLTLFPKVAGGTDVPTAVEGHGFTLADLVDLELKQHQIIEGEVFLHYRVCSR